MLEKRGCNLEGVTAFSNLCKVGGFGCCESKEEVLGEGVGL
jgi:hypothetical protein